MTLVRGTFLDTPDDPFSGGRLRTLDGTLDGALRVVDGAITDRGTFTDLAARFPDDEVTDLRDGLVLPGFVDTHIHYPQVRAIGGLGLPLLEWLDQHALPEELRLADDSYAHQIAAEFLAGLVRAGTTTALVFGAHFPAAVDILFDAASVSGLRITAGLVVSDHRLPDPLLTTPDDAFTESLALAQRWHGRGHLRYAVTPRFAVSCSDWLLAACGAVAQEVPTAFVTSHLNESPAEIAAVAAAYPGLSYAEVYDRQGLLGPRTVLAHNVHPLDTELGLLAERGVAVAHCPTSNFSLGSGLFPLAAHLDARVRVALGSDVGAGSGFSLYQEGRQAYYGQQLLGGAGVPLTATHLLHLATRAGALALDLPEVGHFGVGMRFDAQWLAPEAGTTLDIGLRHAASAEQALATAFTLATPADIRAVYVDGARLP